MTFYVLHLPTGDIVELFHVSNLTQASEIVTNADFYHKKKGGEFSYTFYKLQGRAEWAGRNYIVRRLNSSVLEIIEKEDEGDT